MREPTLRLSRMRDIAGCRLTVPSLQHLLEARDRVAFGISGEVVRVVDYAAALAHRDEGETIPIELERRIRVRPMEVGDALIGRGR